MVRLGRKVVHAIFFNFWPALIRFGSPRLSAGAILSEDELDFQCASACYACRSYFPADAESISLND